MDNRYSDKCNYQLNKEQMNKPLLTKETLKKCMPYASTENVSRFILPLNEVMERFSINTPLRISAFLAQLAHESGSLRYVREIASGEAYEGRKDLGNIHPGDGLKYKGRGLIQLTGRTNYQQFKDTFNVDVISQPELLEQPLYATLAAGWYWDSRKLNEEADLGTAESFRRITIRINGGLNGYEDRKKYWEFSKEALEA